MNPSREYLKQLTKAERLALAEKVGCRQEYLYMIANGNGEQIRFPGRELAIKLEQATAGRIRANDFDDELRRTL